MAAVEEFINAGAGPAERMIRDQVECELAYINTDHPQFLGGSRAIGMVMERRARLPDDSSEDDARPQVHSMAGDLAIARPSKSTGGPRRLERNCHLGGPLQAQFPCRCGPRAAAQERNKPLLTASGGRGGELMAVCREHESAAGTWGGARV